ncbi:hypothetical protein ECP029894212_5219 [Escherichia coli P0298942.12]|nr:hypothetical protein ECP029894212_5219 [Escherichia coli P0298942.12]
MTLPVFITVIADHDKPQPSGCLLGSEASLIRATSMSGLHCWISGDKLAPSGIEGKSSREVQSSTCLVLYYPLKPTRVKNNIIVVLVWRMSARYNFSK